MPLFFLSVFLICLCFPAPADEKPTLTFAYPNPPDHPQTVRLSRLVKEACRRVGYEFRYKEYPAMRATLAATTGVVDGEMSRVKSYGSIHPNLIRVEEHHSVGEFYAYTTNPTLKLDGWDSLKKTGLKVDYRLGLMAPTVNLPKVVAPGNLHIVGTAIQGFERLFRGRADVFVDTPSNIVPILASQEFRIIAHGRNFYRAGAMLRTTGHTWLHEKHRHLAPRFSAAFKAMKEELPHFFKDVWETDTIGAIDRKLK